MKFYTYKLNMVILNILAIILFIILISIMSILYPNELLEFIDSNTISFLCLYMLWIIIHEFIHYIGFMIWKEVDNKNLVLGMKLESSICYCMCKQEINKKVILFSLLLPFTIIGVITLIIGIIINNIALMLLSIFNIVGSIGDIVMTFHFLRLPNDIKYLDLDDPTSFTVISDKDISNIKTIGIKLKDTLEYNKEIIYPKDKRKIVISKLSYVVIVLIILILILSMF